MKLVQAARLSRLKESATGIEKQDEQAKRYAEFLGDEIVASAIDTDISGSTDPWVRPELGKYLRDPSEIDGIIAATLDRLGRNARYLNKLRYWAEDHGKTLIVVSPALRWPPPEGDMSSGVWDVLGRLAEYELAAITKRNRETQDWLRRNHFLVGRPPYGYQIVEAGDHKRLEPDPDIAPIIQEMARRYLAGETLQHICDWLNEGEITSPTGKRWTAKTLSQVLRRPSIIGRRSEQDPKTREYGKTVLRSEPIISYSDFEAIDARMDARTNRKGISPANTQLLTGILRCGICGGVMYSIKSGRGSGTERRSYYYCRSRKGCKNHILVDETDMQIEDEIIRQLSGKPVIRIITIPGNNHRDEIDQIRADIAELNPSAEDYLTQVTAKHAELKRLESLPAEPDRIKRVETGETYGDLWRTGSKSERHQLLIELGWRLYAVKAGDEITITDKMPDNI